MYMPTKSQIQRLCQHAMKCNDRIKSCVSRYLANYYTTEKIASMLDETIEHTTYYLTAHINWFIVEYNAEKSLIIKDIATDTIHDIIAEDEVCLVY